LADDSVDARFRVFAEAKFHPSEIRKRGEVTERVAEPLDSEDQRLESRRCDLDESCEEFLAKALIEVQVFKRPKVRRCVGMQEESGCRHISRVY
jgi:hypothetical protein